MICETCITYQEESCSGDGTITAGRAKEVGASFLPLRKTKMLFASLTTHLLAVDHVAQSRGSYSVFLQTRMKNSTLHIRTELCDETVEESHVSVESQYRQHQSFRYPYCEFCSPFWLVDIGPSMRHAGMSETFLAVNSFFIHY